MPVAFGLEERCSSLYVLQSSKRGTSRDWHFWYPRDWSRNHEVQCCFNTWWRSKKVRSTCRFDGIRYIAVWLLVSLTYLVASYFWCSIATLVQLFPWISDLSKHSADGILSCLRRDFTKLFCVVGLMSVLLSSFFRFVVVIMVVRHIVTFGTEDRDAISFVGPHGTACLWIRNALFLSFESYVISNKGFQMIFLSKIKHIYSKLCDSVLKMEKLFKCNIFELLLTSKVYIKK